MYTQKKQFTRKGGKWSGKYFRGFKCARLLKERMFDVKNLNAKANYEEKCKDVPSWIHAFKTDQEIKEILEKKRVGKLNEKTITVAKTVPIFVTEEDARAIEKKREARRKESAERKSAERKTKSKSASPRTKTAKLAAEAAEKVRLKEEARLAEAERVRLAAEAAKKAEESQLAEAERVRLAAETAEKAEAERVRLAAEAERVRLAAEAERVRLANEGIDKEAAEAAEAEQLRLAAEAEQLRLAEAERVRLAGQLLSPVVYTKGSVKINIYFVDETLKQQFEKELQMESVLKTNKDQFIQDYPEFTDLFNELQNIRGDTPFSASCKDNCERVFDEFWSQESQSTVFMLRLLCNSCIYHIHETPIEIQVLNAMTQFTSNFITITFPQQKQYTIFGLGPSGCGKSTISIPIFGLFPDIQSIVSLDGGIIRETSFAWNVSSKFNLSQGLKNQNSLFNKINVKKVLIKFLKTVPNYTLYVPETLGTLLPTLYLKPFIIQDSTVIVIFIWQHRNCKTGSCEEKKICPFPAKYRCRGCDVSAISRSVSEGKVYTGRRVYAFSMKNAYYGLQMSSVAYKFMIHNSGSANTSIIMSNFPGIKPEYHVNGIDIKFLVMNNDFTGLTTYEAAAQLMLENVQTKPVRPAPRPINRANQAPARLTSRFVPETPIGTPRRAVTPRSQSNASANSAFSSSPSAFSNLPTSSLTDDPTAVLGGTRRKVSRKNKSRRRVPSK